jgi:hypothetical protein
MRKVVIILAAIAALGMLAPPAMAQAPAPKVTINGLVDFVISSHKNVSGIDATDGGKDDSTYSRERGVFTLTGEVGRTKGVWAVELDFTNGAGQVTSGAGGSQARDSRITSAGTSSNIDLDTDVSGAVETKWLYVETPVTGPGSIMPFIPVPTLGRFGAQPARGHEYKNGIVFAGDFPGAAFETTWAPNLRSTLTFVQIGEATDPVSAPNQFDSIAILASAELEVFKGFTVKPTYVWTSTDGGNCGTANLSNHPKNGFNPNTCGTAASPGALEVLNATASGLRLSRHTIGGDIRWTSGPFSLQPTFLYQFGDQEIRPVTVNGRRRDEVDIHAWIFDVIGGFRTGPLLIEGRFMYTPGMGAEHQVQNGSDIGYYQIPVNGGFGYMAGWSEINTSGIDYNNPFLGGVSGVGLRNAPSYDKYGRIFVALAADYSLTPALTLKSLVNFQWTDEDVDTSGVLSATGLTSPRTRGRQDEESYLGTELNVGLTYRFAPNVAFDLIGAYMFTGEALSHARTAGGGCSDRESSGSPACSVDDIWKTVARVRLTF